MSNITKADRIHELEAYHENVEAYRTDGYLNMLNKVGTKQDNAQSWDYALDGIASDEKLTNLYIENGLFSKIIDRPAEDAIAKGLDLSDFKDDIKNKILKHMVSLDFDEAISTAEKWSRLYGGSLVVMLIEDGGGLEDPVNWDNVERIEELIPFERPLVQPDFYAYEYMFDMYRNDRSRRFGEPQFYDVYSQYGSFRVHYSRCLVFRNGRLPEWNQMGLYRGWGVPVYQRIAQALREAVTSHENGTKLLERSVLGVYKMKNLSQLLSTDEGEDKVIQRLQVIDMARNIINSMAIDNDGEDYSYINASMTGASDIIDRTCNMLSAVTDIPQTILFGKDPSGMDSTGDNDRDNYFQLLNRIQNNSYKNATERVIKLILKQLVIDGDVKSEDIPDYEVRFNPLRQMSEEEQASIDATKASTEQIKAQTAQIYVEMQALDASEIRAGLADSNDYELQGIVDDDSLEIPQEAFDLRKQQAELNKISQPQQNTQILANRSEINEDGGAGSGNWGHGGRPGEVGGSAEGSGGAQFRLQNKETGEFTSVAKIKKSLAQGGKFDKDQILQLSHAFPKDTKMIVDGTVFTFTEKYSASLKDENGNETSIYDIAYGAANADKVQFAIPKGETINPHYTETKYQKKSNGKEAKAVSINEIYKEGQIKKGQYSKEDLLKAITTAESGTKILCSTSQKASVIEKTSADNWDVSNGPVGLSDKLMSDVLSKNESSLYPTDFNEGWAEKGEYNSKELSAIAKELPIGTHFYTKVDQGDMGVNIDEVKKVDNDKWLFMQTGDPLADEDVADIWSYQEKSPKLTKEDFSIDPDDEYIAPSPEKKVSQTSVTEKYKATDRQLKEAIEKEKTIAPYGKIESMKVLAKSSADVFTQGTLEERKAGYSYTGGSWHINGPLYDDVVNDQAKALTSLINKSSTPQDMKAYHYVYEKYAQALLGVTPTKENVDSIVGTVVKDKGFMSCGSSYDTGFTSNPVGYEVAIPKGSKGLYAAGFSAFGINSGKGVDWDGSWSVDSPGSENELILQRGGSYMITGSEIRSNGQLIIKMTLTDQLEDE